jgi:hypothetical protein
MRWQYHAPSRGLPVPLTRGNPPSASFQVHDSIATSNRARFSRFSSHCKPHSWSSIDQTRGGRDAYMVGSRLRLSVFFSGCSDWLDQRNHQLFISLPSHRGGRLLPPLEGKMMSLRRDMATHHKTQRDNNTNHGPQRSRTYS